MRTLTMVVSNSTQKEKRMITKLLLVSGLAFAACSAAFAGINETYLESCQHYGSNGNKDSQFGDDLITWTAQGVDISEGFARGDNGRCTFIIMSVSDLRYPMTFTQAEQALQGSIRGVTWYSYPSGSNALRFWHTSINGVHWYAAFFVGRAYCNAVGETTTTYLRACTEDELFRRGLLKDVSAPSATLSPINVRPASK